MKVFVESSSNSRSEKLETSKPDVHKFEISNKIKQKNKLFGIALEDYKEGRKDLIFFTFSCSSITHIIYA